MNLDEILTSPTITVGEVPESGPDDPMPPAEFRMVREALGLTNEGLAELIGVQGRSVRRWEAGGTPIPDGVRQIMEDLEAAAAEQVKDLAARVRDARVVLLTIPHPQQGAVLDRWWRMIAWRVANEVPGVTVQYRDD